MVGGPLCSFLDPLLDSLHFRFGECVARGWHGSVDVIWKLDHIEDFAALRVARNEEGPVGATAKCERARAKVEIASRYMTVVTDHASTFEQGFHLLLK